MARNEWQSFQVIVLPCESDLPDVRVAVSDLKSAGGAVFRASNVSASVVGYVRTTSDSPYRSSQVGWWPDPILSCLTAVDIARGDKQAFWVRFHAPADQPAGDGKFVGAPCQDKSWMSRKAQWADMLADYYINYDSLYRYEAPDFDLLERLKNQGRLGLFNLGYFDLCGGDPEKIDAWKKKTIDRSQLAHDQAKKRGILDHAYIYGADEVYPRDFPDLQRAAALLKQAFPDVPVLTTGRDPSYGMDSGISAVDMWRPLIPGYYGARAERARQAGKKVRRYICMSPPHPFPNMFIEYPPIKGRVLMGPMTAKYRPDGFLYYELAIWNSPPISGGPFTSWNPRSFADYNGDGSWTCEGPDGVPLPTIRLENFRDGLEDYACVLKLEAAVKALKSRGAQTPRERRWLSDAQAALPVPDALVHNLTQYSRDPEALMQWRFAIGRLIDEAPALQAASQ